VLVAPIAAQIGQALEPPHPRLLIMATALICSAGMALPVSGFPNLMAINLEDEVGNRYLSVNDFLKAGVSSFIARSSRRIANAASRFPLPFWLRLLLLRLATGETDLLPMTYLSLSVFSSIMKLLGL